MAQTVTFGETLLRLPPPGRERFFPSPSLQATFGGEANVAVSLARFGHARRFGPRLPEHEIGAAALWAPRGEGLDTRYVLRGGSRLGIYSAETGARQRPSKVIYDRARSAIAELDPAELDGPATLDGARWLHLTGITPALSRGGDASGRVER